MRDGAITSATVDGEAAPLDRVKLASSKLKVIDSPGLVVGSMAQLPKEGPANLIFADNPEPLPALPGW